MSALAQGGFEAENGSYTGKLDAKKGLLACPKKLLRRMRSSKYHKNQGEQFRLIQENARAASITMNPFLLSSIQHKRPRGAAAHNTSP